MDGSRVFFISLVTALIVSVSVTAGYHFVISKPKADPVAKIEPVMPELVEVPNLSGLTAAEAKTRLETLGVNVTVEQEESDSVPKDHVISSTPNRYAMVKKGAIVQIMTSLGNPMVVVPNVRRMPPAKARKTLEAAGLKVEIKTILNEDYSFDRVLRQVPKADEMAKKGSTVTITVNTEDVYE